MRTVVVFIVFLFSFAVVSCKHNVNDDISNPIETALQTAIADATENPSKANGLFVDSEDNTESIADEEDIKNTILIIDASVSWIDARLGYYVYENGNLQRDFSESFSSVETSTYVDYYDGDILVCREGRVEYQLDFPFGDRSVHYSLYYDIEGHIAFADVVGLYDDYYALYFQYDKLFYYETGNFGSTNNYVSDEDVETTKLLCLEYAYLDNNEISSVLNGRNGSMQDIVPEDEQMRIIHRINDRVDWLLERLWDDPHWRTEFTASNYFTQINTGVQDMFLYDNDILVYQVGGVAYYDKLGGGISYDMYYDEEGRLIYADITQYRYFFYRIYFQNDAMICLKVGERTNSAVRVLDEYMINAIILCFQNAYI